MNWQTACVVGVLDPVGLVQRMVERGAVKKHPGPRRGPRRRWSNKPNAEYQRRWRERNPDLARERVKSAMRRIRSGEP